MIWLLAYLVMTVVTTAIAAAVLGIDDGDDVTLKAAGWGLAAIIGAIWPPVWAIAAIVLPAMLLRNKVRDWLNQETEERVP